MPTTTGVSDQLRRDLGDTLARLRMARTVNPTHTVQDGDIHTGCDICRCERRINFLLDHRIPR